MYEGQLAIEDFLDHQLSPTTNIREETRVIMGVIRAEMEKQASDLLIVFVARSRLMDEHMGYLKFGEYDYLEESIRVLRFGSPSMQELATIPGAVTRAHRMTRGWGKQFCSG